jgi:hypothetical protein
MSGDVVEQAAEVLAEHVVDRFGLVWRVVRDGGMATRAHQTGIVSIGIATLERESGPLISLAGLLDQGAREAVEFTDEDVERAAKEAFWTDDMGGHHKPGTRPHTWENIPEVGRENYRTLVRAVLRAALAGDQP